MSYWEKTKLLPLPSIFIIVFGSVSFLNLVFSLLLGYPVDAGWALISIMCGLMALVTWWVEVAPYTPKGSGPRD